MSKTNSKTNMVSPRGATRSRSPGIQGTEPADPCCACLFYSLYSVIWEVAPLEPLLLFHCRDKQWVEQETSCSSCHWQAGRQVGGTGWHRSYIPYISIELKKLHCLSCWQYKATFPTRNKCTLANNRCLCRDKADTILSRDLTTQWGQAKWNQHKII